MSEFEQWPVELEVTLFHAIRGHKPVGVNKHFQMISIHERLNSGSKKLSSKDVWDYLSTLYDLRALNESEVVPFPNTEGSEFELLETEMQDMCKNSFPRTSYITSPSTESDKTAVVPEKVPSKAVKQEIKQEIKVPKSDIKPSTPVPSPLLSSTSKSDSSASSTPKNEQKSSNSSSSIKLENKSHTNLNSSSSKSSKPNPPGGSNSSTPSGKTPHPSSNLKALHQSLAEASASDPSPKRTKRTRNVPSASNSPATPTEPPQKRRR